MYRSFHAPAAGLTALALCFAPSFDRPARAGEGQLALVAPAETAEDADAEAKERFAAGDYAGSAAAFERAYELSDDPAYLFNIGRVYEEAGELESAVEFYDRFVTSKGVAIEDRKLALERLEVLRPIVERKRRDAEPEPAPEPELAPEPEAGPELAPVPEGPTPQQRKLRIAGFATLGAGVALLATGAGLGVAAGARDREIAERNTLEAREAKAALAGRLGIAADVMYGVGGAAALAGVVLVAVGYSKKKPGGADRVAVSPTLGAGHAGATLRYRF